MVSFQTEPLTIEALLNRAENVGAPKDDLNERLDFLFEGIIPTNSTLTVGKKLSAIIRGAPTDEEVYQNLLFMAAAHPGVNLCIGRAYIKPMSPVARATFEVREYDIVQQSDLQVIGRVTVTAGQPVILPAPGKPFEVPEPGGKGNLNVRLRWATPEELLRLSPAQVGFTLYLLEADYAVTQGWATNDQPAPWTCPST